MNVRELNQRQLDQLKQIYLCEIYNENGESPSYGELFWAEDNISNEEIQEIYDGFDFRKEDFGVA